MSSAGGEKAIFAEGSVVGEFGEGFEFNYYACSCYDVFERSDSSYYSSSCGPLGAVGGTWIPGECEEVRGGKA